MTANLDGKVAVVTGAGSGLGSGLGRRVGRERAPRSWCRT